ncbi:MAG: hypothetical protein FIB01_11745 [Gemmatimonadetes bacterium]|nr:hypothetical protein [Gemmatimonadota bacterium]
MGRGEPGRRWAGRTAREVAVGDDSRRNLVIDFASLAQWSALVGVLGLGAAFVLFGYVNRQSTGTELMADLAARIQEGAMAFLRREHSVLSIFVILVWMALWLTVGPTTAAAYLPGAATSVIAGFNGKLAATRANVRTAAAA